MKKACNCLRLVVSKMPDNKGNSLAVVQAGIIKAVFIKRCPVGSAKQPHSGKALQNRQLQIFVQKRRPVVAWTKNIEIFGNVIISWGITRKHSAPVIFIKIISHIRSC